MNTLTMHWSDLAVLAIACATLAWLALEEIFEAVMLRVQLIGHDLLTSFHWAPRLAGFILVGDEPESGITHCNVCLGVWINLGAYPLYVWFSPTSWGGPQWWQHGATLLVLMFATAAVSSRRS